MDQMPSPSLHLVSHHLCPYVQRAVIALEEKGAEYRRTDIDLSDKPDWFIALSPLGKVPVLRTGGQAIFESAVIIEYLEETLSPALHPATPLERARHRSWIEFASRFLDRIGGFYSAPTSKAMADKQRDLVELLVRLNGDLAGGPYFAGDRFSLVDAAMAPALRYFDTFERIVTNDFFAGLDQLSSYRATLARRPSVIAAAPADYDERLLAFLKRRDSHLGRMAAAADCA